MSHNLFMRYVECYGKPPPREKLLDVLYASHGNEPLLQPREIENAVDSLYTKAQLSSGRSFRSTYGGGLAERQADAKPPRIPATAEAKEQWLKNAEDFASGTGGVVNPEDVWEASPIRLEGKNEFLTTITTLFRENECVGVMTGFDVHEEGGKPKAIPRGGDEILAPEGWRRRLAEGRAIRCKAGGWMRVNPVSFKGGSGKNGAVTDVDITDCRHLLIENDILPLPLQLTLLCRLPLNLVAIIDSGGKSFHGIARINAKDQGEYKAKACRILHDLRQRFGFDQSNENPSKLTRLPAGLREIGRRENGNGEQSVLFLSAGHREAENKSIL